MNNLNREGFNSTIQNNKLIKNLLESVFPKYVLNQRYGDTIVNNFTSYFNEHYINNNDSADGDVLLDINQQSIIDNNQIVVDHRDDYDDGIFVSNFTQRSIDNDQDDHRDGENVLRKFKLDDFEKETMWYILNFNNIIPNQNYHTLDDQYLFNLYYHFHYSTDYSVDHSLTAAHLNLYKNTDESKKLEQFDFEAIKDRYEEFAIKMQFKSSSNHKNAYNGFKPQSNIQLGIFSNTDTQLHDSKYYDTSLKTHSDDGKNLSNKVDFFQRINYNLPTKFYAYERNIEVENFKTVVDGVHGMKRETSNSKSLIKGLGNLKNFTYIFGNREMETNKNSSNDYVHCFANAPLIKDEIDLYYFETQLLYLDENATTGKTTDQSQDVHIRIGFLPCYIDDDSEKLYRSIEIYCRKKFATQYALSSINDPANIKSAYKRDSKKFVDFVFNEYKRNFLKSKFQKTLHNKKFKEYEVIEGANLFDNCPYKHGCYELGNLKYTKYQKVLEIQLQYLINYKIFKYGNYYLPNTITNYRKKTKLGSDKKALNAAFTNGLTKDTPLAQKMTHNHRVDSNGESDVEDVVSEVTSSTGRTRPRRRLITSHSRKNSKLQSTNFPLHHTQHKDTITHKSCFIKKEFTKTYKWGTPIELISEPERDVLQTLYKAQFQNTDVRNKSEYGETNEPPKFPSAAPKGTVLSEQTHDKYSNHDGGEDDDSDVSDEENYNLHNETGFISSNDNPESYFPKSIHDGTYMSFHDSSQCKMKKMAETCLTKEEDGFCIDTSLLECHMNDVVGVGINFLNDEFFVTKNGEVMEIIDLSSIYPFDSCIPYVALNDENAGMVINHGGFDQNFVFDIDEYFAARKRQLLVNEGNDVQMISLENRSQYFNHNMKNYHPNINSIIYDYLINKDLLRTSNLFFQEVKKSINNNEDHLKIMLGSEPKRLYNPSQMNTFGDALFRLIEAESFNRSGKPSLASISLFIRNELFNENGKGKLSRQGYDLQIEYILETYLLKYNFLINCMSQSDRKKPTILSQSLRMSNDIYERYVLGNLELLAEDWREVCQIYEAGLGNDKNVNITPDDIHKLVRDTHNRIILRVKEITSFKEAQSISPINELIDGQKDTLSSFNTALKNKTYNLINNQKNKQETNVSNDDRADSNTLKDVERVYKISRVLKISDFLDI